MSNRAPKGDRQDRERSERAVRRGRKPKVAAAVGAFDLNDFKNVDILKRFLSETGKILPRRRTGLNAQDQRKLARTIKRARMMGLLPFTEKLVRK
ncbi:MAG: 30S ribosomal protein S18 [Meiothermus sp.]|uniref:30S ribosomal protein S18 n=1 Tax=Meiothermus sp. TaxID=1955249 RepID=UPI0025F7B732|nr:30S ribosomal protein S18 [Meiothermus sp.]MCS7068221.1 30S ribosomal protein S18 [Meiothermus sp.]MDW8425042.1 30S ribosomal protein S18 [Meiothermus sp.]